MFDIETIVKKFETEGGYDFVEKMIDTRKFLSSHLYGLHKGNPIYFDELDYTMYVGEDENGDAIWKSIENWKTISADMSEEEQAHILARELTKLFKVVAAELEKSEKWHGAYQYHQISLCFEEIADIYKKGWGYVKLPRIEQKIEFLCTMINITAEMN